MTDVLKNPFVSTFATVHGSCPFPTDRVYMQTDGKKFYWITGYWKWIEVTENQIFDDFGNVSYEINFPK